MNKFLYTFFFGFLPFKYKRLTRTILIFLPVLVSAFTLLKFYNNYDSPNEKAIDFIYEKYQSEEYASEDFYTTSIGNERTQSFLINKYGNDEFLNQINQGILQKMTECTRPDKEFTKDEFIAELPKNKALSCIAFAIGKQENISGINIYTDAHDFVINGLKIQFHDLVFNKIIPLIVILLLFLIFIGITSYLLEPFVHEKSYIVNDLGKTDVNPFNVKQNFRKNDAIEKNQIKNSRNLFNEISALEPKTETVTINPNEEINDFKKPQSIKTGINLLVISFALGIINSILRHTTTQIENSTQNIFTLIFTFAIMTFFIHQMNMGKKWARTTFLILSILGSLILPFTLPILLNENPIVGGIAIIVALFQIIALFYIFHKNSSKWFNS